MEDELQSGYTPASTSDTWCSCWSPGQPRASASWPRPRRSPRRRRKPRSLRASARSSCSRPAWGRGRGRAAAASSPARPSSGVQAPAAPGTGPAAGAPPL